MGAAQNNGRLTFVWSTWEERLEDLRRLEPALSKSPDWRLAANSFEDALITTYIRFKSHLESCLIHNFNAKYDSKYCGVLRSVHIASSPIEIHDKLEIYFFHFEMTESIIVHKLRRAKTFYIFKLVAMNRLQLILYVCTKQKK